MYIGVGNTSQGNSKSGPGLGLGREFMLGDDEVFWAKIIYGAGCITL